MSVLIYDIYTDSDTGIATDADAAGPPTDTAVARVDGLRWHVRHAAVAEQPKTKVERMGSVRRRGRRSRSGCTAGEPFWWWGSEYQRL